MSPVTARRASGRADLHTHTTASDGTLSPEALWQRAVEHGVTVLAITDHDTTAGYEAVRPLAEQSSIRLIPAIEMSAEGAQACHLLGYFVRPQDAPFQAHLTAFQRRRVERVAAMVERLNALGISITAADVQRQSHGSSIGRPHVADALVAAGLVKRRQEAFDRFLHKGGPAYVDASQPTAEETISVIRRAGGVAVLAHPAYDATDRHLDALVRYGLQGIEAYYPDYSRAMVQRYLDLAGTYGLIATGGSDFHGPKTHRHRLACVDVPLETADALERMACA